MKILGLIPLVAASCWAANPQVSNVALVQDAASHLVTVTYDLADADAIVTLDVTTNGVSVGARNLTVLSGDVNRKVSAGTGKKIVWNPDAALVPYAANATAVVSAWREDAPPDYMAINLLIAGEVRYYPDVEALPYGGLANDCYRKDILLMRRIPAKCVTWYMGQRSGENGGGSYAARETRHQVTLTNDFWMGVFEFTSGQWRRVMPSNPDVYFTNTWCRETRPVEQVSYQTLRGTSTYANWPASSVVSDDCLIGRLRAHAGLPTLDLPTEAQWEYACRAGAAEALYTGYDLTVASPGNTTVDPNVVVLGRYYANGGGDANSLDRNLLADRGTAKVGSYLPNDWGLYDMLGNVYEWCLDRCASTPGSLSADAIDPVGPASGDYRVRRGGCWGGGPAFMRAAYRGCTQATTGQNSVGFRVAARIVSQDAE